MNEKQKSGNVLKMIGGSYVLVALIALVLCDVTARLTFNHWSLDRYNSPNRSWVWWNTKDFRETAHNPDIMLMGSSLMMAALHGGDATYLQVPQNVALHHRSTLLENLLQNKLHAPVTTFAFAIGGQMASDAYAIASTLFHGDKKPRTIIYGIAPRDFMDNTMASPGSSETFKYMERIGGVSDIALPARTFFWDQAEWACGQVSFLYNRRLDFVYLQNKYARQILSHLCGMHDLEYVHTPVPLRKIAMLELPEDSGPGDLMVMPYEQQPHDYSDNLPEYRSRYKTFKAKLFNMQLSYLEKLLKYCDDEGINVVLVNMPLTQDNVSIMPNGFYVHYLASIGEMAVKHHDQVLDLNDPKSFPKTYFADSVHLNGAGGQRFFEVLSDRLVSESRVALGNGATTK